MCFLAQLGYHGAVAIGKGRWRSGSSCALRRRAPGAGCSALAAATTLFACGCGPSADDYPLERPDAGYPDAAILVEPPTEDNFIEDDPLEDWDMQGAGPLSGIFAVEVVIPAKVMVELEARELLRMRLLQHGTEVRIRSQMCRIGLPVVSGVAELEIPLELEKLVRSKVVEAEGPFLSAAEPVGATFEPPGVSVLLGATLAKPETDPLPTADAQANALDEDGDGEVGVTLYATTLLCAEREAAYVALRAGSTVQGQVVSDDEIEGSVEPVLDQSVLGFSDPCMAVAANLPIALQPGASFRAIRVNESLDTSENGNVTCGEIVQAAADLFGPYWE